MDELYRQMWELFWAGVTIIGGIGFVWLALELIVSWALDRKEQGSEVRDRLDGVSQGQEE